LIAELTSVVEQQCDRCERHPSRLPGSSEVIESLIGKGKRLLGTSQNNTSLTGQILSIAASTANITASVLLDSMRRCRIAHVQSWLKKNIQAGIHVARGEDLSEPGDGTKLAQIEIATTPTF
jgi:type IV secretory pathway VirB6-like protein